MLNKRSRNIVLAVGVAILAIVILELVRPQPLNWRVSYTSGDRVPFGCYVLYQELPNLLGVELEMVNQDPYEFFLNNKEAFNTAYLLINENYYLDKNQVSAMKDYVFKGNTVFLSANNFGNVLLDSLNINTYTDYSLLDSNIIPKFYNKKLNQGVVQSFKKRVNKSYFVSVDTLKTEALGYYEADDIDDETTLNFIRLRHGDGSFVIHTLPQAFTNFYLLNGRADYAANVLSYIDADKLYWDSYLKVGKKIVSSPIQFVLTNAPLKWAYYLTMFGLIGFVLFAAKREQRIIAPIQPLENTSVEFTKAIGSLYLQHGDFNDIITKKLKYFMDHVRSKYFINAEVLNDDFIQRLAQKTNHSFEETETLIRFIKQQKEKVVHTEADLIKLNKKLEAFKL